jgi:hypothetical protein
MFVRLICAIVILSEWGRGVNPMENWYVTWQIAQGRAVEIREAVRHDRWRPESDQRTGWPRRVVVALFGRR